MDCSGSGANAVVVYVTKGESEISSDLTVAPVIEIGGLLDIALVPPPPAPVGPESSKEVDRSGGMRGQGTRTGSSGADFFLS